jgi:senataxin
VLGEPSLLNDTSIALLLDRTAASSSSSAVSSITALGLSPMVVKLLSSPRTDLRRWALKQIPAMSRRPLSFEGWCENGVGVEVQNLYLGDGDLLVKERWSTLETLIQSGCLSVDAIQQGLLGGRTEVTEGCLTGKGIMAVLCGMLGGEADCEYLTLRCELAETARLSYPSRLSFRSLAYLPD